MRVGPRPSFPGKCVPGSLSLLFLFSFYPPISFSFSCSKKCAAPIPKVGGLEPGALEWREGRKCFKTGGLALCLAVWGSEFSSLVFCCYLPNYAPFWLCVSVRVCVCLCVCASLCPLGLEEGGVWDRHEKCLPRFHCPNSPGAARLAHVNALPPSSNCSACTWRGASYGNL